MDDKVDAIIRVKVPKWQIGEEVSIYFPDTMTTRGKCEIMPAQVTIFCENADAKTCEELKAEMQKAKLAVFEERPQGEWYYSYLNGWHCSICHGTVKNMPTVMGKANFAFCPNCGAKMKGD